MITRAFKVIMIYLTAQEALLWPDLISADMGRIVAGRKLKKRPEALPFSGPKL